MWELKLIWNSFILKLKSISMQNYSWKLTKKNETEIEDEEKSKKKIKKERGTAKLRANEKKETDQKTQISNLT